MMAKLKNIYAAFQSFVGDRHFFGMVARQSWGRSPTGGHRWKLVGRGHTPGSRWGPTVAVRSDPSVLRVLAVDLSTQRQHHVRARGTWDFVLPGAKRLNNTLHRRTTR